MVTVEGLRKRVTAGLATTNQGSFATAVRAASEQSTPHRELHPPKRRQQARVIRAQRAMDPNAAITSILHLYDAGAQTRAISLAFQLAERSRLPSVPLQILAIPSLADAWKCGKVFGDEERAFARGYQHPHVGDVPEEFADEPNLRQKFRNGQAARKQIRYPRLVHGENA